MTAPDVRGADRRRPRTGGARARPTVGSGGDLLHVRQHRARQGCDAQPRDARLDVRERGRRASSSPAPTRFLPGSSMSHIGSFLWALAAFSVGASVVVARTFDAGEILPLLRAHHPTVLAMIPAALTALVRDHDVTAADFASLRVCRVGADSVSSELEREFSAPRRVSHRRGIRHDRGRARDAQPSVGPDQAGIHRPSGRRLRHLRARRGARRVRERHRRPGVDPDAQPDHRVLGEPRRPPPRSCATAGSTPATSPTPTTTATCGSSAARSRSSCTTARTSARWRSRARSPSIPPSRWSA